MCLRSRLALGLLALVVSLLAGGNRSASAAPPQFDAARLAEIRPQLEAFVAAEQIQGAVTVVGTADGIVSLEAVGRLGLATEDPLLPEALFRIASMTKPITALAIMQLADQGRLSPDDPVEKHLSEFQGQWLIAARGKDDQGSDTQTLKRPARPITIRDLLTHTSGLPGGYPAGMADLYQRRRHSLAEATLIVSQRPLEFEPGSQWAYCNAGIDTLGRIIEVVSGQPYEDFLRDRVFEPLGMHDTTFYPTPIQLTRLVELCDVKDGHLAGAGFTLLGPTADARHPIPAGGLYSTGGDLARLYQMMLRRGEWEGRQIVSAEAVATMTQVQTGDLNCGFTPGMGFGFGWAVVREPQGVTEHLSAGTFGHGGAFGTQAWIDPTRGMFLVLLIQRLGLPNADGAEMRREFQRLAINAISDVSR